jgi:hypothetical protein
MHAEIHDAVSKLIGLSELRYISLWEGKDLVFESTTQGPAGVHDCSNI